MVDTVHRVADIIRLPCVYGTSYKYIDAAAELGRNPVKHQIQPECRDEQADAGRDCRTVLRCKLSGANAGREIFIFPVQTTSRFGNLIRLIHKAGRPGSSEVHRHPLTRWDVSSIPANGIFLTKKQKNENKNAQRVEND